MSPRTLLLSVLLVLCIGSSRSANILAVFSCPYESHLIVEMSMAKVLAEAGHNVTVITTLKPRITHKNMHVIYVPLTEEEQRAKDNSIAEMTSRDNSDTVFSLFRLRTQMKAMSDKNRDVMFDPRVRDLTANKGNKFDLVMIGYFLNSFQIGIAQKLKVPVVLATSLSQSEIFDMFLGEVHTAASVPSKGWALAKGQTMPFRYRLVNYISLQFFKIFVYLMEKDNENYYKEVYGDDPDMPPYEMLNKNVSLVFFNSHAPSEGPIRPNFPGAIEVGGIQVKEKPDPLPKDIADFLENAPIGAILLSLGSNVKGTFLKPETVKKMFNVLSKLKQKVIWKWEDLENLPGKSENILYSKWLPQDDILSHPSIKLFINHAGRGGITESQFHGKPMLSLPVFGDQPPNAAKMVYDGFGLSISLLTLEEDLFHNAIRELLENPKYTENVQTFSKIFRDRPLTARQSVLYWTEYVLRHHGAPHLQSPQIKMSYIASNNLDIYSIIIAILMVFVFIVKKFLRFLWRKLTKSQARGKKLKTN